MTVAKPWNHLASARIEREEDQSEEVRSLRCLLHHASEKVADGATIGGRRLEQLWAGRGMLEPVRE